MAVPKRRAPTIVEETVARPSSRAGREPIAIPRLVPRGKTAFDTVEWRSHDAAIKAADGKVIFEQKGIKAPTSWSETSINIAASKYFRVIDGRRENSVDGMIRRVTHWIAQRGLDLGYLDTAEEATRLEESLSFLMVHRMAAFNSPVWFNVGVRQPPQCSACFIQSVSDDMDSILGLATSEGRLFKGGSGTGSNLSSLRGSHERLSGGGIASGPVSFMRAFDALAGVIKSGGTTRRAAKMVILNMDHPDILDFIDCKVREEDKALALIREGYSSNFDGTDPDSAYASIAYQNANHSVRIPDAFIDAVVKDGEWKTYNRTDHSVATTYRARDLWRKLAYAAWRCGDPGVQYDDITNDWHTSPMAGRINASNPCSEYLFLDDTACNLASINLMKFLTEDRGFDLPLFRDAVRTMILAMEIVVDASSYPTSTIAQNSHDFRPLGLGYANLGSLLMHYGLAYDSDPRTLARRLDLRDPLCGGVPDVGGDLPARRLLPRLRPEPLADAPRHGEAPRGGREDPRRGPARRRARPGRRRRLARDGPVRRDVGLSERPDLRHRPDRDHRSPDGMRHPRPRAGALPRQGEEPRRGRCAPDGEPHRRGCAPQPRLLARRRHQDHRLHRGERHHRGRPGAEAGAPPRVRLRARARRRHPDDPADGPPEDARRRPAVPVGRRVEDDQPAERGDRRGDRGDLPRGVEARHQVGRPLPRRLQSVATVRDRQGPDRRPVHADRCASGSRTSERRSRTTSPSGATTAT